MIKSLLGGVINCLEIDFFHQYIERKVQMGINKRCLETIYTTVLIFERKWIPPEAFEEQRVKTRG